MLLNNVKINISNVSDSMDDTLAVNSIAPKREFGKLTREPIGYNFFCSARKGDTLKVTLPVALADRVTKLSDLVEDEPVRVRFSGLKLKLYAMQNSEGKSFAGVSAKADDFEIVDEFENLDSIKLEG